VSVSSSGFLPSSSIFDYASCFTRL